MMNEKKKSPAGLFITVLAGLGPVLFAAVLLAVLYISLPELAEQAMGRTIVTLCAVLLVFVPAVYQAVHYALAPPAAPPDDAGKATEAGGEEHPSGTVGFAVPPEGLWHILDGINDSIYVTDIETDKILFANRKILREFGAEGPVIGQTCWKVLRRSVDRRCELCPVRRLMEKPGTAIVWEAHNACTGRFYRNTDRLIEWTDGRMVHLQYSEDITKNQSADVLARKRLEQQEVIAAIVGSAPQYIASVNQEGMFDYFNPGVPAITRYTAGELQEGGLALLFDQETRNVLQETLLPRVLKEWKAEFELPLIRKDGQRRILFFSAFKTDVKNTGIGLIASDITEKREMEKELVAAKEHAEHLSQEKGEFLSRMSHEIRTPMNAIIGMTNIARASHDPQKKEYCLEKIDDASRHLLGVINDILDLSKIEASKFELSLAEFQFERMLIRVIDVIKVRMDEKNQRLITRIAPDVPCSIITDEQRLAQVIINLLSNASKFTPEHGAITLAVSKIREWDDSCVLQIEIIDTGIGISKEQQKRLFHSFEQADGTIVRRFGGTGLGLVISKNIIEMMGGKIWVSSEPGQGATFAFTVTAAKGDGSQKSLLNPDINWANIRILVVDDAPEVREYFLSLSQAIGFFCMAAASGEEACCLIEENKDQPFHLVFADWKMPSIDGVELARTIKERYGKDVVVIMISASEWSDIEAEAKTAGISHFVPKPLFSSLIVNCISECLHTQPSQKTEPSCVEGQMDCFSGCRILLAEDTELNQEIVLSLLEDTGVLIDCAANGLEAYTMFREHPERYGLIFMDIHMPEMDGYEATGRIRGLDLERARSIPIVAMTANVFREDIERCLAAGMNDHIGKPIDLEEMLAIMKKYLPLRGLSS